MSRESKESKNKQKLRCVSFQHQTLINGRQMTGVSSNQYHNVYLTGLVVSVEFNNEEQTTVYIPIYNVASYEFINETNQD